MRPALTLGVRIVREAVVPALTVRVAVVLGVNVLFAAVGVLAAVVGVLVAPALLAVLVVGRLLRALVLVRD